MLNKPSNIKEISKSDITKNANHIASIITPCPNCNKMLEGLYVEVSSKIGFALGGMIQCESCKEAIIIKFKTPITILAEKHDRQ